MKKKDLINLKGKTLAELEKLAKESQLGLVQFTAKIKGGSEKNLKKAKNLRREIAQVLTIIREKELTERKEENKEVKGNKDKSPSK